jgi:hypothetical protein
MNTTAVYISTRAWCETAKFKTFREATTAAADYYDLMGSPDMKVEIKQEDGNVYTVSITEGWCGKYYLGLAD